MSAPLRIAQLANFVGPVSGGIRTAVDQLGRGYLAAGAERILVVPGAADEVVETEVGLLVRVRAPRLTGGYRMIAQPWRALDVLDQFNPTSVEVSDKWTLSPVARWAKRRRIGSVLFSHERLDDQAAFFLKREQRGVPGIPLLYKRLARAYDRVVVTSRYAEGEWAPTRARTVMVPLGVDLETFHPSAGHPVDDGVLKLTHIGRLSREKSPHLAVATAVELHRRGVPTRLDVYGTGPHLAELQEIAGDAPVVFHGYVGSRREVAEKFAAADFSLSVCPIETFGLAVLEGLASGTPVITADRGGARELVDETSGAWGAPDPRSLADAVLAAAARPRDLLRTGARARAEKYSWDATVQKMLTLHRGLG